VFPYGSIVLTRFPSTDLSGDKRRPALVISPDNDRRPDLVVCFITSLPRSGPDMAAIAATAGTGLKVPSVVRFDKLATLDHLNLGQIVVDVAGRDRIAAVGVRAFLKRRQREACHRACPGDREPMPGTVRIPRS